VTRADVLLLLALNAVAFCAMGVDKRRARAGRSRVPEARLLLLGLLSGGLGAWLGMAAFRHKTRKRRFQLGLALATAAGAAGWVWWFRR
jgi:uncharacterized membrane protein YsdA (DUF1294 family)